MQRAARFPRRNLALQVYALLCVLTGVSGLALSVWTHPGAQAARLQMAASQYEQQSEAMAASSTDRLYLRAVAADLNHAAAILYPHDSALELQDMTGARADAL